LTILLIEDNADDVAMLVRAFKRSGFRQSLRAVSSAEEAIEYLSGTDRFANRHSFPLPVFIILDLTLRGMSGLEFLAWARQNPQSAQIPVVVLSASPYAKDVSKAYELGAKTFFTKPLADRDLDAMLKLFVADLPVRHPPPAHQPAKDRTL
jgi:CheY-like chemotaxis protein